MFFETPLPTTKKQAIKRANTDDLDPEFTSSKSTSSKLTYAEIKQNKNYISYYEPFIDIIEIIRDENHANYANHEDDWFHKILSNSHILYLAEKFGNDIPSDDKTLIVQPFDYIGFKFEAKTGCKFLSKQNCELHSINSLIGKKCQMSVRMIPYDYANQQNESNQKNESIQENKPDKKKKNEGVRFVGFKIIVNQIKEL